MITVEELEKKGIQVRNGEAEWSDEELRFMLGMQMNRIEGVEAKDERWIQGNFELKEEGK